jgi:hypothetical protein
MSKKTFSTRQKGRRSIQGRKTTPGRLGKRPVEIPRTGEKQRAGDAQRRHAGR